MAQLLEKPKPQRRQSTQDRFTELGQKDPVDQCEFFLKSFIFALGDQWQDVPRLCTEFQKHAKNTGDSSQNMNHIQAADFCKSTGRRERASSGNTKWKMWISTPMVVFRSSNISYCTTRP